jgi:hypothetical protein
MHFNEHHREEAMSSTEWQMELGDGKRLSTPNIQHRTSNEETRKAEALKS